jgi:hypothetical protein
MHRRFLPLAILVTSLLGCSEKKAVTSPKGGPNPGESANPNAV